MGMKPVNFAKVIAASGLSKKQIADMKGVKPETCLVISQVQSE